MDEAEFEEDLNDPQYVTAFIQDWNESRLDMFALSLVSQERNVFGGVMRFYFQDRGLKAVTKCVRVNSQQTVGEIMPMLIEKFCPDMKMLSTPNYELYEIHGTGDVRRLTMEVKPLIVQCLWHRSDREGRFVLKSSNLKIQPQKFFEVNIDEGQLRRRLSRREKKDLKKKRKEEMVRRNKSQDTLLADRVYRELPESSLTRTISNPEAVMRRRRQQKLEKRMKEFQNKEGPQTGGILKVFAESLKPEIPYKTILASVKDNADAVTKAALEKFMLLKEDPSEYCIVMAIIPPGGPSSPGGIAKERTIRSSDCPLAIQNSWPKNKGIITFHLRRKQGVPVKAKPNAKKVTERTKSESGPFKVDKNKAVPKPIPPPVAVKPVLPVVDRDNMPFFLELTPEGKEINYKPKLYYIGLHETIIGSSRNPSPGVQYLQLFSPKILASHCSIVNVDGSVSIVPHGPEADVRVNGQRIFDNTILHTSNQVQFGGLHTFRFCNPVEEAESNSVTSNRNSTASVEYQPYKSQQRGYGSMSSPPISPELKELILNEQVGSYVDDEDNNLVETTFGVDGEIETNKTAKKQMWSARSAENLIDAEHHQLRDSFRKHRQSAPDLLNMDTSIYADNLLPASLAFLDQGRDAFFAAIISEVNGAAVNFKLAPTYTLYLAARYILSTEYRPALNPVDRTKMLNSITKRIALTVQQTIQENDCLAGGLAFWMANASELLHFYRQDVDLGPLTQPAQAVLAQSIQESFALLVNAMEEELSLALPAFLDPSDSVDIHPVELDNILNDDLLERAESTDLLNWTNEESDRSFRISLGPKGRPVNGDSWVSPGARIRHHGSPVMADILYILSSAMSLLRRCRVNAALTIQLFSQLFHYINMWVFNRIVLEPDLRLCTRLWGHCLSMRLSYIEAWAERQGLELAADCHLARVVQAVHLLEAPKETPEEIADLASCCFKLNSLQLRVLLENYLPEDDEPLIPQELIDSIVAVAESTSDELSQDDGYDIKLEEDIQLQLPFLLPEEGYSSDIIRGIPPGLQEFLDPLSDTGLCTLRMNPQSQGIWTVYQEPYTMEDEIDNRGSQDAEELPVERITIDKGKGGLGLSICAAKGAQSDFTGIYIKNVIAGGLAEKDGRLEPGDQILKVNEVGLVDVTQTQAAKVMGKSGPVMTLEIIKGAAFYHGLSKLVENEDYKQDGTDGDKQQPQVHNSQPPQQTHQQNGLVQKPHHKSYETNIDEDLPPPTHHVQAPHSHEPPPPAARHVEPPSHKPPPPTARHQQQSVEHNQPPAHHQVEARESDYDSDGELLTKDEKEKRARQRQRQIEYEERLAKWEADRVRKEEEEARQLRDEDDELETKQREEDERIAKEEEKRLEAEAERRYEEEVQRKRKEREEDGERMRMEEQIHGKDMQSKKLEEDRRAKDEADRRTKKEKERLARENEEKIAREEEEQFMMEELQKWEAEEALRKEEEQNRVREKEELDRREEEERKREVYERKRLDEDERRQRIEDERRLQYEERQRYEEQQKKIREEEEKQRRESEDRRRYEEQQQKRRDEDERRRKIDEDRRAKLDRLREEERQLQEQAQHELEEKRKQEKLRLIEERRKKESDDAERERRRKEAEDNRRLAYKQQMERRKQEEDELERERIQREETKRREAEEERHREEERRSTKAAESEYGRHQLDKEMASIDDALREAERIAAEMDLFMFEEEQKIEADSEMKKKKERQDWLKEASDAPSMSPSQGRISPKVYHVENKPLKRSTSKENILETNLDSVDFLPPPPEELLGSEGSIISNNSYKYETNIDSDDEDKQRNATSLRDIKQRTNPPSAKTSHQSWLDQQRDKREKQRLEQERMTQEKLRRNEEERRKREEEAFAKSQLEARRRDLARKEQEEKAALEKRFKPPPPAVKPKVNPPSFQVGKVTAPSSTNHRVEYSPNRNSVTLTAKLSQQESSDEDDAPPRPPPPRGSPRTPTSATPSSARFNYAGSNGYTNDHSRSASNSSSVSNENNASGLVHRGGVYSKRTPPPVVVNKGVGEPEVLDFRSKMKLFGK